jgi:hypothetical protein
LKRRLLVLGAALAAVLTPASAIAGPGDAAKVRACVERNLVRYTTPDRAVVAQYVDITAACHAALAGDEDVAVVLAPLDGDLGSPGGGGTGAEGAEGTAQERSGPDGAVPRGRGGDRRGPAGAPAAPRGVSATADAVRAALAAPPETARPPGVLGLAAAPPWILGLLAAGLAGSAGAAAVGWRRRR